MQRYIVFKSCSARSLLLLIRTIPIFIVELSNTLDYSILSIPSLLVLPTQLPGYANTVYYNAF